MGLFDRLFRAGRQEEERKQPRSAENSTGDTFSERQVAGEPTMEQEFPPIEVPWTEVNVQGGDLQGLPASELFKLATAVRQAGDLERAITIEKHAIICAESEDVDYGIKQYSRLPKLLQEAGRGKEALPVFEWLLGRGFPAGRNPQNVEPMILGDVFDTMRLFWQREDKHDLAMVYGVLSLLGRVRGLVLQGRNDELPFHKDKSLKALSMLRKKAEDLVSPETLLSIEKEFWQDYEQASHIGLAQCREKYLDFFDGM